MAQDYPLNSSPEQLLTHEANKLDTIAETLTRTEEGSIEFNGVLDALHEDGHQSINDQRYIEVLQGTYNGKDPEQIWQNSDMRRTECFQVLGDLREDGYINNEGLTGRGKDALETLYENEL